MQRSKEDAQRLAGVAAKYLHDVWNLDPVAIQAVIDNRVQVNKRMEDDENCPVVVGGEPGASTLGALGLINGLLATLGIDRVVAVYDAPDSSGARELLGFNTEANLAPR